MSATRVVLPRLAEFNSNKKSTDTNDSSVSSLHRLNTGNLSVTPAIIKRVTRCHMIRPPKMVTESNFSSPNNSMLDLALSGTTQEKNLHFPKITEDRIDPIDCAQQAPPPVTRLLKPSKHRLTSSTLFPEPPVTTIKSESRTNLNIELAIKGQDIRLPPPRNPTESRKTNTKKLTRTPFKTTLSNEDLQSGVISFEEDIRKLLLCQSLGVSIETKFQASGNIAIPVFHCPRCLKHWAVYNVTPHGCKQIEKPTKGPSFQITNTGHNILQTFQAMAKNDQHQFLNMIRSIEADPRGIIHVPRTKYPPPVALGSRNSEILHGKKAELVPKKSTGPTAISSSVSVVEGWDTSEFATTTNMTPNSMPSRRLSDPNYEHGPTLLQIQERQANNTLLSQSSSGKLDATRGRTHLDYDERPNTSKGRRIYSLDGARAENIVIERENLLKPDSISHESDKNTNALYNRMVKHHSDIEETTGQFAADGTYAHNQFIPNGRISPNGQRQSGLLGPDGRFYINAHYGPDGRFYAQESQAYDVQFSLPNPGQVAMQNKFPKENQIEAPGKLILSRRPIGSYTDENAPSQSNQDAIESSSELTQSHESIGPFDTDENATRHSDHEATEAPRTLLKSQAPISKSSRDKHISSQSYQGAEGKILYSEHEQKVDKSLNHNAESHFIQSDFNGTFVTPNNRSAEENEHFQEHISTDERITVQKQFNSLLNDRNPIQNPKDNSVGIQESTSEHKSNILISTNKTNNDVKNHMQQNAQPNGHIRPIQEKDLETNIENNQVNVMEVDAGKTSNNTNDDEGRYACSNESFDTLFTDNTITGDSNSEAGAVRNHQPHHQGHDIAEKETRNNETVIESKHEFKNEIEQRLNPKQKQRRESTINYMGVKDKPTAVTDSQESLNSVRNKAKEMRKTLIKNKAVKNVTGKPDTKPGSLQKHMFATPEESLAKASAVLGAAGKRNGTKSNNLAPVSSAGRLPIGKAPAVTKSREGSPTKKFRDVTRSPTKSSGSSISSKESLSPKEYPPINKPKSNIVMKDSTFNNRPISSPTKNGRKETMPTLPSIATDSTATENASPEKKQREIIKKVAKNKRKTVGQRKTTSETKSSNSINQEPNWNKDTESDALEMKPQLSEFSTENMQSSDINIMFQGDLLPKLVQENTPSYRMTYSTMPKTLGQHPKPFTLVTSSSHKISETGDSTSNIYSDAMKQGGSTTMVKKCLSVSSTATTVSSKESVFESVSQIWKKHDDELVKLRKMEHSGGISILNFTPSFRFSLFPIPHQYVEHNNRLFERAGKIRSLKHPKKSDRKVVKAKYVT
ncbi:uncharacterized protein LOC117105849 [Anneissia japonica]|uniref:uncharacterized protein LOC117105849 n=1 Tax=Anneissia japonica TaxID=1529436 RepID=UPI001425555F|nr:uncharacterized protein LOC117105849 [Anneissia japonica]